MDGDVRFLKYRIERWRFWPSGLCPSLPAFYTSSATFSCDRSDTNYPKSLVGY